MAEAVAEKKKIKEDEFDIHGDLAVSEADDKSFVVLYDSSKGNAASPAPAAEAQHEPQFEAPSLDDLNESHVIGNESTTHPEDAYIDDILSSDDIDTAEYGADESAHDMHALPPARPEPIAENHTGDDEDGPIALSSEELDGILEMGPATEEEFHPDFPPENTPEAPPLPEVEMAAEPMPAVDAGYDDDELPIALSDEDLDEILLEEEGTDIAPPEIEAMPEMAPAPVLPAEPQIEPAAQEDEEPIALSDDELDNILADAEAGHAESGAETVPPMEDEILTLDEEPEITMIDDSSAMLREPEIEDSRGTGPTEADHMGAAQQDTSSARSSDFFDSDEDEPITLSDEELDGILSSAPEEAAAANTQEIALESGLPNDGIVEVEDDEPVALSADELDGILMDAEEAPERGQGNDQLAELPPEPAGGEQKGFFDSDEDEPIALSADELDGIAATAVPEEHVPAAEGLADLPPEDGSDLGEIPELTDMPADAEEPPVALMDERYADVDHMAETADEQPGAAHEEDDGPIALSADELDGIVADALEVTPEAPMVGLGPMDSGAAEPSLAENTEKPATVFEEDLEAATLIHEDETAQAAAAAAPTPDTEELKSVMTYLDNLLGELPDDVIEKFAQSEYFKLYQKIMDKLGL